MSHIFDLRYYPMIYIRFNNQIFEDNLFNSFEQNLLNILKNSRSKIKIMFDFLNCTENPPIKYVFRHGSFLIEHDKLYKKSVDRTAIILPYNSWKIFVNILFTFKSPSRPNIVTLDYQEGLNFLRSPQNQQN